MSAFLCSDEHIKQLASWLVAQNSKRSDLDRLAYRYRFGGKYVTPQALASHLSTILLRENERSLSVRYGEDTTERSLVVTLGEVERMRRQDLAAIAKSAHCYRYQACESEDWETTKANKIIQEIEAEIVRSLPGYSDANWGKAVEFHSAAPNVVCLSELI